MGYNAGASEHQGSSNHIYIGRQTGAALSKAYYYGPSSMDAYSNQRYVTDYATPNTGYDNIAIGYKSLFYNSTGSANIAIGVKAMGKPISTGPTPLPSGWSAEDTIGWHIDFASATPTYTAYQPNTGTDNIAIGRQALYENTSGYLNVAIGYLAMSQGVVTGAVNIALGYRPLDYNTTGSENIAMGTWPLHLNTTGYRNFAFGYKALYNNTTGTDNIAFGYESLYENTTDWANIAIGFRSLKNSTGVENTAIGFLAGSTKTSGYNNTFIGYNAQPASATDNNQITLGNANITHLRCQVTSITALSDSRDKTNIQDSIYGLDFVNKLRPVTFEWNMRDGGKVGQKDLGFLAQELVELEDSLQAHDILNLTLRSNPEKLEASYGRLVPVLVKAIQDLSAQVEDLKNQILNKGE